MLIYLCIIHDYFCTSVTELSHFNKDQMAHKAWSIYYLAHYKKHTPTLLAYTVLISHTEILTLGIYILVRNWTTHISYTNKIYSMPSRAKKEKKARKGDV